MKKNLNEQLSRIKGMMGLNEASDEEVIQYNAKLKNSHKVLQYLDELFANDIISREVYHDFRNAINSVLKRYHNEMNGGSDENMDEQSMDMNQDETPTEEGLSDEEKQKMIELSKSIDEDTPIGDYDSEFYEFIIEPDLVFKYYYNIKGYGEDADVEVVGLTIYQHMGDDEKILYDGHDFTNFTLPDKIDMDILNNYWDEYFNGEPNY